MNDDDFLYQEVTIKYEYGVFVDEAKGEKQQLKQPFLFHITETSAFSDLCFQKLNLRSLF